MGTHPETLWRVLTYASMIGALCLIGRLVYLRLLAIYPALALLAAMIAIKAGALSWVPLHYARNSPEYIAAWDWTNGATLICLTLAGVEIFCLTVKCYPRRSTAYGGKVFVVSSIVALAIALLPFTLDTISRQWSNPTWAIGVLIRTVSIAVGLGLTISTRHFKRVRIPERKNLRNNRILLILYCIGQAVAISGLIYTRNLTWTTIQLASAAICLMVWPWLISSNGEGVYSVNPTDRQRTDVEKRWTGSKLVMVLTRRGKAQSPVLRQSGSAS